jgi:hypothetical protein
MTKSVVFATIPVGIYDEGQPFYLIRKIPGPRQGMESAVVSVPELGEVTLAYGEYEEIPMVDSEPAQLTHGQVKLSRVMRELDSSDVCTDILTDTMREAAEIVGGKRYGRDEDCFDAIALGWSGLLGTTVTAKQVCLCMDYLKSVREVGGYGRDNFVDKYGYTMWAERKSKESS